MENNLSQYRLRQMATGSYRQGELAVRADMTLWMSNIDQDVPPRGDTWTPVDANFIETLASRPWYIRHDTATDYVAVVCRFSHNVLGHLRLWHAAVSVERGNVYYDATMDTFGLGIAPGQICRLDRRAMIQHQQALDIGIEFELGNGVAILVCPKIDSAWFVKPFMPKEKKSRAPKRSTTCKSSKKKKSARDDDDQNESVGDDEEENESDNGRDDSYDQYDSEY